MKFRKKQASPCISAGETDLNLEMHGVVVNHGCHTKDIVSLYLSKSFESGCSTAILFGHLHIENRPAGRPKRKQGVTGYVRVT